MALTGGSDRSELRPLKPDGNVDHDLAGRVIVGNHKGNYGGYNIADPKPGTVHQYGTRRDVLAARQRGWWIAGPDDGTPAYELVGDGHANHAPGDSPYADMVHLVTSEENYRRLVAEQQAASRQQLAGSNAFLENVSAEEYETGKTERGYLATRFATREHGTYIADESGKVVEHLTPQGILREEDL